MSENLQPQKNKINPISPMGLPNPIDTNIGKKIASKRSIHFYSRQDFADLLGIPESVLDRMEHGQEKIPVAVLWYIAALLETDLKEFFEDISSEFNSKMFVIPEPKALFLTEESRPFYKKGKHNRKKKDK